MRKVRLITAIILVMMLALPSFALAVEEGDTQPQNLETGETSPPQHRSH
jgi:hypothetical protein